VASGLLKDSSIISRMPIQQIKAVSYGENANDKQGNTDFIICSYNGFPPFLMLEELN